MDVFRFRDSLVDEYESFSRSFTRIRAGDISSLVEAEYQRGRYWPPPLLQINPHYKRSDSVQEMVAEGILHPKCGEIFRIDKDQVPGGRDLRLFRHQVDAIAHAAKNQSYVVTTGTGSGKSLAFFIPIIDRVLKAKEADPTPRTRAIVIYPMNALANSQREELRKFLGGQDSGPAVQVARYTGIETRADREAIAANPPDILLTNFMMLELILSRYEEVDRRVIENCHGLEFLVLDELHTYRGRQGADVGLLVRRLRQRTDASELVCVGTSATMASEGPESDRNQVVAAVASRLFGQPVTAGNVVTETLERVTDPEQNRDKVKSKLASALSSEIPEASNSEAFRHHPVAVWIEVVLGIDYDNSDKPQRAKPQTLDQAADLLCQDAGVDFAKARDYLRAFLLNAFQCQDEEGRSLFAFKLHQFVSGPGRVWCSLEHTGQRHVTLDGQKFAPGRKSEQALLFATYFCRECGQDYHPVWEDTRNGRHMTPRDIDDTKSEDDSIAFGFVAPDGDEDLWPGTIEHLPDAWLDLTGNSPRVKQNYKPHIPQEIRLSPDGRIGSGMKSWFLPGKFRFCLRCGYVHEAYGKDINRLSGLSGEGRSSATTMLSLAILRELFRDELPEAGPSDPRKLLGFSDNRQDAALQAGHFNDFVYLLTLRAGLLRALRQAPNGTLTVDVLAQSVFQALGFDTTNPAILVEYLQRPAEVGLDLRRGQEAMRAVLGHRLHFDLRRGWRFNNPNLEQLGMLEIGYDALDELVADPTNFRDAPPILERLELQGRFDLCRFILDYMRERLCIASRHLDPNQLDQVKSQSYARLCEPWAFADDERPATFRYLITVKRPQARRREMDHLISGGARSRLARQLKRAKFWATTEVGADVLTMPEAEIVALIEAVLAGAGRLGLLDRMEVETDVTGWRVQGDILQWRLKESEQERAEDKPRINRFFRALYDLTASAFDDPAHGWFEFEAQEHTAQVDADTREMLEARFRYTDEDKRKWKEDNPESPPLQKLPVMYCSPTMELGVDISALNFVYLRNVPPTPANYAQRGGRAGRSGQPALVVTYCASQSPHDQHFFEHPEQMVHGEVRAPTLDLANKDLIASHLNATWLACTQIELPTSISEMLDLADPAMPLLAQWRDRFSAPEVRHAATTAVSGVLDSLGDELTPAKAPWFKATFADEAVTDAPAAFDEALNRWRSLYKATDRQMTLADAIARSHSASQPAKKDATRRYLDASRQRNALIHSTSSFNSDFYTYRYLAGQGFLPGYNFPRLPLMAWIPATRRRGGGQDDGTMVSRPRFLALAEFGPRSLIYHQGRMYRVVRAMLDVTSDDQVSGGGNLPTITARVCTSCGYGHLAETEDSEPSADICESCHSALSDQGRINALYRIENVATVPTERITVNDEERQRQGFEMQTTFRYARGVDGVLYRSSATVTDQEGEILELQYGPVATVWRINKGWRRRKDAKQLGFYINTITGGWSKSEDPNAEDEGKDETEGAENQVQQIVPYVEDRRNILILRPTTALPAETMATLQMAIKRGIEQVFQVEESELVTEPLPTRDLRNALLFYEAAEGGAGVLTRLATEPGGISRIAAAALEAMHFKPVKDAAWDYDRLEAQEETDDQGRRLCETACYKCLLSYFNQPDHDLIDRWDAAHEGLALKLLVRLANATVTATPEVQNAPPPSAQSLGTKLLEILEEKGRRLPDASDVRFGNDLGVAAYQYKDDPRAMIFFGSPDSEARKFLEDRDFQVVCFPADENGWDAVFANHPDIFRRPGTAE